MNAKTTTRALGLSLASTAFLAAGAVLAINLHGAAASAAPRFVPEIATGEVAGQNTVQHGALVRGGAKVVALQTVNGVDPMSTMGAFLASSFADIDATWVRIFSQIGLPTPTVATVWPMPGESVKGQCGDSSDTTMMYCTTDDTITFSQQIATGMWLGSINNMTNATHGDMGVTLLLAHEYGHNIETEIGKWTGQTEAARERGADCFAGVWAADATQRGILDSGDLTEGYAALDLAAEHPELGVQDNVHGSAQQRIEAFEVGRTAGIRACIETYLPGADTLGTNNTATNNTATNNTATNNTGTNNTGTNNTGTDNSHNPFPDQPGLQNPTQSDPNSTGSQDPTILW
jgi:predicted metalloprotease